VVAVGGTARDGAFTLVRNDGTTDALTGLDGSG
jgi:hypothetical protein